MPLQNASKKAKKINTKYDIGNSYKDRTRSSNKKDRFQRVARIRKIGETFMPKTPDYKIKMLLSIRIKTA